MEEGYEEFKGWVLGCIKKDLSISPNSPKQLFTRMFAEYEELKEHKSSLNKLHQALNEIDDLKDCAEDISVSKENIYDGSSGLIQYKGIGTVGYVYTIIIKGTRH